MPFLNCPLPAMEARVLPCSAAGTSRVYASGLWDRKKEGGPLGTKVTVEHPLSVSRSSTVHLSAGTHCGEALTTKQDRKQESSLFTTYFLHEPGERAGKAPTLQVFPAWVNFAWWSDETMKQLC